MKKIVFLAKFYIRAFIRLEIMNKAAGLSFYTIISIFPILLLLVVMVSQFLSKDLLSSTVTTFIKEALPYRSELIMNNIAALFAKKTAFSWVGVIALFLSAQVLYNNFGKVVNSLLHTAKQRHFLINRLLFLLWLMGMLFVLFAPVIFEITFGWLTTQQLDLSHISRLFISKFFMRGGFVLVGFFVFWIVMSILPTHRLRFKRVLFGSIGFALTLQIGKLVFKWVTLHNLDRYNLIYGSLTSMVLVMLWIFYFYNMFLFFVYWIGRDRDPVYVERKNGLQERKEPVVL